MSILCRRCNDARWVCEEHDHQSWSGHLEATGCYGPGMPCPACNEPAPGERPHMGDFSARIDADRGPVH
jgi:hypothetical protein